MLKFYITYNKQGIIFGVLCEGAFFPTYYYIFFNIHIFKQFRFNYKFLFASIFYIYVYLHFKFYL